MKVQAKFTEIAALFIVILLSIAASLTDHFIGNIINQKVLLAVLIITIVITLFRTLRLMLFITIIALAIGANMPKEISESLGINPLVMLIALALLFFIPFVNRVFKLFPIGKDIPLVDTIESRKSILTAVTRGDMVNLHRLLKMNVEINFSQDGSAPIFIAAENGYADIMQILMHHGARIRVQNEEGKTPMEIALARGFTRTAEILHFAAEAKYANRP